MNVFASTSTPLQLNNKQCQDEFNECSEQAQRLAYDIKLLNFMRNRQNLEMSSFSHTHKLDAPPLNVLISAKADHFLDNAFRFFLTTYEPHKSNILSNYFDKVVVDIGSQHFEWTRNVDSLEIDGLEFILSDPDFPLSVSYALYPDFPVPFYIIPDDLQTITGTNVDCLAKVIKNISQYASKQQLIEEGNLICDDTLRSAFGMEQIPFSNLPLVLSSHLIPLQPIKSNFFLDKDRPIYNISVKLPNFTNLPQNDQPLFNTEILNSLNKFAQEKENLDLLAAIERNPFEAIEAEIAGHATYCELSDEANDNGPEVSIDQMNPPRRSTPFYWQPWVSDYAPRFLEENKLVHSRYPKKEVRKSKK